MWFHLSNNSSSLTPQYEAGGKDRAGAPTWTSAQASAAGGVAGERGGAGRGRETGGGGRASARARAHPLPPLLLSQAAYDAVSKRLRDDEAHLEAAFDAAAVKAPKEGWRAAAQA